MNIEKFNLGRWKETLRPFIESEACDDIYKHLKERSKAGHTIYPLSEDLYKAFNTTDPKFIKAVIIGANPYQNVDKKNNPFADGLLFSNSRSKETSSYLKLYYNALEKDYNEEFDRENDLSYLTEQGVLLLNASLTCEQNKASIHNDVGLWNEFNKFLFKEVFHSWCGVPFLFIGKEAEKLSKMLFPLCHVIKVIEHPAQAAKNNRDWENEECFHWINQTIEQNNGELYKIQWNKHKITPINTLPF